MDSWQRRLGGVRGLRIAWCAVAGSVATCQCPPGSFESVGGTLAVFAAWSAARARGCMTRELWRGNEIQDSMALSYVCSFALARAGAHVELPAPTVLSSRHGWPSRHVLPYVHVVAVVAHCCCLLVGPCSQHGL